MPAPVERARVQAQQLREPLGTLLRSSSAGASVGVGWGLGFRNVFIAFVPFLPALFLIFLIEFFKLSVDYFYECLSFLMHSCVCPSLFLIHCSQACLFFLFLINFQERTPGRNPGLRSSWVAFPHGLLPGWGAVRTGVRPSGCFLTSCW